MPSNLRTSEFWTSIITHLAGAAVIVVGALRGDNDLIYTGCGVMVITQGSYNISRGLAKQNQSEPPSQEDPLPKG